jgi:hemerythrin
MREYDYETVSDSAASRHREEHRSFSQQVLKLREGLHDGRLVTREELLTFLNQWLVNHILHTDKQLGAYLIQQGYRPE